MNFSNLREAFDERFLEFTKKQAHNDVLDKQINDNENRLLKNVEELGIGQEAIQFLEDVANSRRSLMKNKIEGVVTEALRLIYGQNYHVELLYDVKNNRSFLDIEVVKKTENGDIRRNMTGFGGGVSDSISVPLRLLVLIGSRKTDSVCVLDEAYKHVDLKKIDLVGEFLSNICEKLSIQTILCSHHERMDFYADKIHNIEDCDGKSVIHTFSK